MGYNWNGMRNSQDISLRGNRGMGMLYSSYLLSHWKVEAATADLDHEAQLGMELTHSREYGFRLLRSTISVWTDSLV